MFTETFLRNGCFFIRLLYSNGCTHCLFRGLCLAMGLWYNTVLGSCKKAVSDPTKYTRIYFYTFYTPPHLTKPVQIRFCKICLYSPDDNHKRLKHAVKKKKEIKTTNLLLDARETTVIRPV
jgi:hypothetical protein